MRVADKMKELIARSRERSGEREQAKFSQWLQLGGQPEPDTETKVGFAAWSRLHDLYEFCEWVKVHNATITETMPFGLVAADGPDERHYKPEGGLAIEEWPYLKSCCVSEDEEFIQISRDEIVEAILTNQLQKMRHSYGAASSAVEKFASHRNGAGQGPLWTAIEELPFENLMGSLDNDATTISKELSKYNRKQKSESHPYLDGLDEGSRTFLWHGKPSRALSGNEYRLMSALWFAPEHSLPLEEVIFQVWGIRAAAIDNDYPHRVRELGRLVAKKIDNITISVTRDQKQIGVHHRVTLDIL